jgi:equilibrative nucleoside transporter 1/2/3
VQLGSWYPILLITLFNVSDVVGKTLPIKSHIWLHRQHLLLAAAAARAVVLLPLMVVSAVQEAPTYVMALLTVLLGVTNG